MKRADGRENSRVHHVRFVDAEHELGGLNIAVEVAERVHVVDALERLHGDAGGVHAREVAALEVDGADVVQVLQRVSE